MRRTRLPTSERPLIARCGLAILVMASFAGVAMGLAVTRRGDVSPTVRTIVLGGQPTAIAVDTRAGRVVVVNSMNDTASVLDEDGALLATVQVGREPEGVAIDERTGHAFVINTAGASVSVLDTRTGALLHTTVLHGVGGPTAVAVAGAAGRVFVLDQRTSADFGSGSAFLSVLDARSGALVQSRPLSAYTVAAYPGAFATDDRAGRVVAVTGGDSPGVAYLLDSRTGAIVRIVHGAGTPYAMATDEQHGSAYLVDATFADVEVLDTRRGVILRRIPLQAVPYAVSYSASAATLDAARGVLFIAGTGAGLHVLDTRVGTHTRIADWGGEPTGVAVDGKRDRIFALDRGTALGLGRILVLDARSGTVRQTITVGAKPSALALDPHTGRLFVANGGGSVRPPDRLWWAPAWLRRQIPGAAPPPIAQVAGSVSVIDSMR